MDDDKNVSNDEPLENDDIHSVEEIEDMPNEGDVGYTPEELDDDGGGLSTDANAPDERIEDRKRVLTDQDPTGSIEEPEEEDARGNMEI